MLLALAAFFPQGSAVVPDTPVLSLEEQVRLARAHYEAAAEELDAADVSCLTPEQRILILDSWKRSELPAGDFAPLVGLSKHTLYAWKKKFEQAGPAGLMDRPKGGPCGSRDRHFHWI